MSPTPERINREQRVMTACALDTVPLLGKRVTNLLSWGRRISLAHRWLGTDSLELDLKVGLHVDDNMGDRAISGNGKKGEYEVYGVYLAPGIESFGFSAYASDGNVTEEAVWKRYHSGEKRRDITLVELTGGLDDQGGPGRSDELAITYWNQHGVGRQTVIGFDTHSYSDVWQERENKGWDLGGHSIDVEYCQEFAQVGPYRVRCSYPVFCDSCMGAGDHVPAKAGAR